MIKVISKLICQPCSIDYRPCAQIMCLPQVLPALDFDGSQVDSDGGLVDSESSRVDSDRGLVDSESSLIVVKWIRKVHK